MKTKIIANGSHSAVIIPTDLSWDAVRARISRAEKKLGLRLECSQPGLYLACTAAAKSRHRRVISDRDGSYNPSAFGPRSFHCLALHSRAARKASQWLQAKSDQYFTKGQMAPARQLKQKGVPGIAWRLAAGACCLSGPQKKLP